MNDNYWGIFSVERITTYVTNLSEKQFRYFVISVAGGIGLLTLMTLYGFYHINSGLAHDITQLYKKFPHLADLRKRMATIDSEQTQIQAILEEEVSLPGFFESFGKQHNLRIKSTFEVAVNDLEDTDEFDELAMAVTLETITTKKLTYILHELQKNNAIYIKELKITKAAGSTISTTLVCATLRKKYGYEE